MYHRRYHISKIRRYPSDDLGSITVTSVAYPLLLLQLLTVHIIVFIIQNTVDALLTSERFHQSIRAAYSRDRAIEYSADSAFPRGRENWRMMLNFQAEY